MARQQYRARNLANGKCADCRQDRDQASTRFCLKHLNKNLDYQRRHRQRQRIRVAG